MSIHSKLLVHWTGKKDIEKIQNLDERRSAYLERLKDTCKRGLFMKHGEEHLQGVKASHIKQGIVRVCFTEIRLSQAKEHADRYGKMGIAFHRDFVLEREGNPVFYVQNGTRGHVVEVLAHARQRLDSTFHPALDVVIGYLKGMGEPNEPDLKYYDEMEWRILQVVRLMGKYIVVEDREKMHYRLILNA